MTRNESRDYASDARSMFSLAITYLLISITVIGIGYTISESVSKSLVMLLDENQNISADVSRYIAWQVAQKALNLRIILVLGIVSVSSAIGLMLYSTLILGRKKEKMEKLYFDILQNKISGRDEDKKCNEIASRYMDIVKNRNVSRGMNKMSNKKLYTIIFGTILLTVFGVIYYFTYNLQLIFSGLVAVATIAYAYLTARLVELNKDIRDIQKTQMEPNINIDFQHDENNMNMVHMIVENIGKSTAYNVKIDITPDMEYVQGRKLSDLPIIKNTHDIPANKRIKFFLTNMLQDTDKKTKEPYKINVDYEDESGKNFHKEFEIDLKMLAGTLYSAYSPMKDIRNFLDNINKNIDALANGRKKITVVSYSREEEEKEKQEEIKRIKEMTEKKEIGKKKTPPREETEKDNKI